MIRPHRLSMRRRMTGVGAVLALVVVALAGGAANDPAEPTPALEHLFRQGDRLGKQALAAYRRTPATDRITWGGLIACAALALGTAAERMVRLRKGKIIPSTFIGRFRERMEEGRFDRTKALDFCELNPSPAARVVLAALQRWGRPVADLERGVVLARGREIDLLRRHIGTLRRVAGLAPLLGLLGTLTAAGRALTSLGANPGPLAWGPTLASALAPLTAGVTLAILALVAFDGLTGKVDGLAVELDRLGAETVDAVALAVVAEPPRVHPRTEPAGLPRTPHAPRVENHEPSLGFSRFGD
ncbi:MAG: MotA/TolQ/ExbB proton channel family protein [Isosphaeraceae bacterium]